MLTRNDNNANYKGQCPNCEDARVRIHQDDDEGHQQWICDYCGHKWNVKYKWGGIREGAGRPVTGRKKHQYYITDEEDTQIKNLINQLRNPSK